MIDEATLSNLATRFSLPPPLLMALQGRDVPPALLAGFGMPKGEAKANPVAALTILAHAVSSSFQQHGSLESALSHVFSGDPAAFQSPTSPVGGVVVGILADAARSLDRGWQGFQPSRPETFGRVARDFGGFLEETRAAGGIVTDEALRHWNQAVQRHAPKPQAPPPRQQRGTVPDAPVPHGPKPQEVEQFAGEMKGLGIDVGHFLHHFETYSALRFKMMQAKTELSDYAEVAQMNRPQMLEHVRAQPHPVYRSITAGAYSDMHDMAHLHSLRHAGRTPYPSEVAKLVSAGAGWNEVAGYYEKGAKPRHA